MIYIITPSLKDFKSICSLRGIDCKYNFNGYPKSTNVIWVTTGNNLLHRLITKDDEIIYGFKFCEFTSEEQKRLTELIHKRTTKC
jgi:hypothetical protein